MAKVVIGDRVSFNFAGLKEFGKIVDIYDDVNTTNKKKVKETKAKIISDGNFDHRINIKQLKKLKNDTLD